MDLDKLIEREINKEQEERKTKERSGLWNPSSFGRCFRQQYWNRENKEVTNPPDMKALKTFLVGTMFHNHVQSYLPQESVEVEFTQADVHGFADYVGEDFVADFKTVGAWQWKKINGKDYSIEKDNFSYLLQLMSYCYFLGKEKGVLVFICKDTFETKVFEFYLRHWENKVVNELETLRKYWNAKELPEALPRAYGLNDCRYCGFCNACDKIEGNTEKERKKNAEAIGKPQKAF